MTQTAIAEKAYISVSTLSDYKNRNKLPSLTTFAKLCEILEVSADEILGIKE